MKNRPREIFSLTIKVSEEPLLEELPAEADDRSIGEVGAGGVKAGEVNAGGVDDEDVGSAGNPVGAAGAGVGGIGTFSGLTNSGFGGPIGTIGLPFAFGKAGGICVAHPGRKMVRTNVMQRHRKKFNVIKPPFFDRMQSEPECSTCNEYSCLRHLANVLVGMLACLGAIETIRAFQFSTNTGFMNAVDKGSEAAWSLFIPSATIGENC